MQAARRSSTRDPGTLRRRTAGGSVLGLGLLVVAAATAPAALATDGATPVDGDPVGTAAPTTAAPVRTPLNSAPPVEPGGTFADDDLEPFYGTGKSVVLSVEVPSDTAPADLDLTGTEFTLTGPDGQAHVCAAGADGTCTVSMSQRAYYTPPAGALVLPDGEYSVTQTGHAQGVRGPAGEVGTVELVDEFSMESTPPVVERSVFRTSVAVTVTEDGGVPVVGAAYQLSGPDHLHRTGVRADAQQWAAQETDDDGVVTFAGFFLPGAYLLTPEEGVAAPLTVETPTLADAALPWSGTLVRPAAGSGSTSPSAPPTGVPVPTTVPVLVPATGSFPGGAPVDTGTPTTTPPTTTAPVTTGAPVPSTVADPLGAPVPAQLPAPTAVPVAVPAGSPEAGAAAPSQASALGISTRSDGGRPTPVAGAVVAEPVSFVAPEAGSVPTASAPSTQAPASSASAPVRPVPLDAAPELTTVSSSAVDPLVVTMGVGFLITVVCGLMLVVRRRARFQD